MSDQLNLFSPDEVPPKRGRGRPRFEFTPEKQWLIRAMVRWGFSKDEIAARIGCSSRTLHDRFFCRGSGDDQ